MHTLIDNISIVLVATTHPGNIGATARAMKTMGLKHLKLVSPKVYPSADVTARAAGADDILANVQIHETLEQAISDCGLIYATSARLRSIPWPCFNPEQAARHIVEYTENGSKAAIVFGRESSGLTNEELDCCNAMLQIPANPDFSSLNIASAVQIVCYELNKAIPRDEIKLQTEDEKVPLATAAQMDMFYEHLESSLIDLAYLDPEKPRRLMRRLKRLFNRSRLDENEYNILRGILAAVQEKAGPGKK